MIVGEMSEFECVKMFQTRQLRKISDYAVW